MDEDMGEPAARVRPGTRPVRTFGALTAGALLAAGAAWLVRGIWEIRLAAAGEPASGPPDQGDGLHRPLNGLEDSYHVVTSVGGGVAFVCALLFLAWLWRVRDNARMLSGRTPKYLGIWVYLGWIVPVVNLWFPRGIVADAFRATAPERRLPRSVNVWWALWLAGMFGGAGIVSRDSPDETIARAYHGIWPLLAADAAVVGAAVAGAVAVRAVSAAQVERIRQAREEDARQGLAGVAGG
ncbi:DUF4328 domain-containing protein [Streptomyces sp. NPDC014684]|uniref:DUF4328 domain-containing protein n=1 Tax=Streptomyces sp. NPDC014684 TaxID=3364880 RepID=UPI0036FA940F